MVQIWPTDDNFAQAGTDYTYPNRYIRFVPATTSTTYQTGLVIKNEPGHLVTAAIGTAAGAEAMNTPSADASSSFYARTAPFVDGEVTASFRRYDASGIPTDSTMSRLAVYGRVNKSAHSLVSASGEYMDEYLDRPDCIEFAVVDAGSGSANDCYFVVGYYTAGLYSSLGSINISTWSTATLGIEPGMGYYDIARLRMVMNGTSIKCYAKPKSGYAMNVSSPVRTVDGEIEVFSVSVSAPSASGYAGFALPVWWTTGTWTGGHVADWFQVKTGGTITLRDEFQRLAIGEQITGVTGGSRYSIASAYSGDGASNSFLQTGSTYPARITPYQGLMHGTGGEIHIGRSIPAAFSDPDLQEANYGLMYDMIDYGVIPQRRQLDFEFNASGASCGILLRGSKGPGTSIGSLEPRFRSSPTTPDDEPFDPLATSDQLTMGSKGGFCCVITYDTAASPQWLMRVLRIVDTGDSYPFPDAIATADLTLFGLTTGTTIELDFEVRNFNANPDGSGGNIGMRAAIGGVDVDLVAGDFPGVSFQDGWLYDLAAPTEHSTNTLTAMFAETYLAWGSAVANHVVIKRWQHLAQSDPPVTTDPDQPSVALEAEDYGKTGTFNFPIDWSVREDRVRAMREMRTEAHYRYKSPIGSRTRRSWSLKASGLSDADRDSIIEFLKDHNGPEIPFDWHRADTGDTIAVRYISGSFNYRKDGIENNSCSLAFEEVFSELEYNAQV